MGRKDSGEDIEWKGWDQVGWGQDYQRLGRKRNFGGERVGARTAVPKQCEWGS